LNVGISLVGNPELVFLDEPSSGMDPGARRFLWDLISEAMHGRSVILTTHSLDEAEALCGRIGIMVGGRLRCLGTASHLKQKYGQGYQLDINTGEQTSAFAIQFIRHTFPGAVAVEVHPSAVKYRIPKQHNFSTMFQLLESNRQNLRIREYSLSETTLEQIFIYFAKQQDEETDAISGLGDADEQNVLAAAGLSIQVIPNNTTSSSSSSSSSTNHDDFKSNQ